MNTKVLKFGGFTLTIGPSWTVTKFDDGVELHAHSNHTESEIATANALGYDGDVDRMTREHDLFHHLLAEARGWWHSNVIWNTAHGDAVGPGGHDEECIVMLMQRLSNGKLDDIMREHER